MPYVIDPQRILEVLARDEVQCLVIGGYAAVLAGIEIVSRDIDLNRTSRSGSYGRAGRRRLRPAP